MLNSGEMCANHPRVGPASGGAMMSLAVGGVRAEITAGAVTGVNELGVACGLFDSYDAFQAAASAVLSAFLVTSVSFAEVQASLLLGSGTSCALDCRWSLDQP